MADIELTAEDKTKAAFESVKANALAAKTGITSLAGSIAGLGAAVAGLAIVQTFRDIINEADKLNKISQSTGIATEALSELSYAAKLSDVAMEELGVGLRKLAVNASAAAGGAKEQSLVFETLGIKVKDAEGKLKGTDNLLSEIADKFADFKDGPAKAALAVEVFGKSGDRMIPLLNNLRETREEAKRLAPIFGKDLAEASEKFNDNITRLEQISRASKVAILSDLVPALTSLQEKLLSAATAAGSLMKGLFTYAITSGDEEADPSKAIGRLNKSLDELKKTRDALGGNPLKKILNADDLAIVTAQIKGQEAKLAYLKELQVKQTREYFGDDKPKKPTLDAPIIPKAGEKEKAQVTEYQRMLKSLQDELAKVGSEGRKTNEVLANLANAKNDDGSLTKAARDRLVVLAEEIQREKDFDVVRKEAWGFVKKAEEESEKRAIKAIEDLDALQKKYVESGTPLANYYAALEEIDKLESERPWLKAQLADARMRINEALEESGNAASKALEAEAQGIRALIDPNYTLIKQLERIRYLQSEGVLGEQEAATAGVEIYKKINENAARLSEKTDDTNNAARDLGLTFTSAFEASIKKGAQMREVLQGIYEDLVKIAARKLITEPAAEGLTGFFKSAIPAIGGAIGSYFGGGVDYGAEFDSTARVSASSATVPGAQKLNSTSASAGGAAGAVTIQNTYQIDSRSDRAQIMQDIEQGNERTKQQILTNMRRGGQFRTAAA